MAIALSWAFAGVLLQWLGFDEALKAEQTSGTFLGMRLSMCLGAAVPALGCFIVMRFYPLTKKKAAENRKILEARRGKV